MSNTMTSSRSTIDRYFGAIDSALEGLEIYLREESSPLYQHELLGKILTDYIDRLQHSFSAWQDRVAFTERFRINQAESGYPAFRHVLDLDNDARTAEQQLAELPSADELRLEMIDYILIKKKFPAPMKSAMAKRLYLEQVLQGDVFQPLILPKSVRVAFNPKSGRPFYVVHWGAFDGSASLPMIYVAVIEDSSPGLKNLLMDGEVLRPDLDIHFPVDGLLNPDLAHQFDDFCEKNSAYGLTLATIADNMDRDFETLHPTQLRRIIMGPFYSAGVTSHGQTVEKILETVSRAENAWMLTWTIQELFSISETPGKWGLWGNTPARQTYHIETHDLEAVQQGVSAYQRHALIPHEAYQAVYASGKRDEIFAGYATHVVSSGQVLRDF